MTASPSAASSASAPGSRGRAAVPTMMSGIVAVGIVLGGAKMLPFGETVYGTYSFAILKVEKITGHYFTV